MRYYGINNVPGAPGNLLAVSPTPGGGLQPPLAYGSSNLPNAVGNMGGMMNPAMIANSTFYNGMPPIGFQGKHVYGA